MDTKIENEMETGIIWGYKSATVSLYNPEYRGGSIFFCIPSFPMHTP